MLKYWDANELSPIIVDMTSFDYSQHWCWHVKIPSYTNMTLYWWSIINKKFIIFNMNWKVQKYVLNNYLIQVKCSYLNHLDLQFMSTSFHYLSFCIQFIKNTFWKKMMLIIVIVTVLFGEVLPCKVIFSVLALICAATFCIPSDETMLIIYRGSPTERSDDFFRLCFHEIVLHCTLSHGQSIVL